jgi:hypothetical protein
MNALRHQARVLLSLALVLHAGFARSVSAQNTELSGADELEFGRLAQWSPERDNGGYIR